MTDKFIKLGIKGLNSIITPGLPSGCIYVLAGSFGVGKTTFSMQVLCYGASIGETGLFLTTYTESEAKIIRFMREFTFFKDEYLHDKLIEIFDLTEFIKEDRGDTLKNFIKLLVRKRYSRIIIDPFTFMSWLITDKQVLRSFLYDLSNIIMELDALLLLTYEYSTEHEFRNHVLPYIADGIFYLKYFESGPTLYRVFNVRKLRGIPHSLGWHRVTIKKDGLEISPTPEISIG
jgi:circadian clock protein KaiC